MTIKSKKTTWAFRFIKHNHIFNSNSHFLKPGKFDRTSWQPVISMNRHLAVVATYILSSQTLLCFKIPCFDHTYKHTASDLTSCKHLVGSTKQWKKAWFPVTIQSNDTCYIDHWECLWKHNLQKVDNALHRLLGVNIL